VNLAGMGVVFPGGAGVPALRAAWAAGVPLQGTVLEKEGVPILSVPAAALTGNPVLAPARRADRFSKMTLLAAMEALAGCATAPDRTGIVLATAFGPHGTVFRYVNEMLEYGDAKASPTVFSQSVHAAAASMIAVAAKLRGPALSVADLAFPFEEALALADGWLEGGRCDAVLVGAVDEATDVLAHVVRRKWPVAADGIVRPSAGERTPLVPGEGAVFFRLERGGGPGLSVGDEVSSEASCHLFNAGAPGGNDAELLARAVPGVPARCHVGLWGSTRIGAAFHLAVANLMRCEGRSLADPGAWRVPPDAGSPAGDPRPGGTLQVVSTCGPRCRTITLAMQTDEGGT
jgi:3-oxoacyl-[acyl-carrier-protein] synthase II